MLRCRKLLHSHERTDKTTEENASGKYTSDHAHASDFCLITVVFDHDYGSSVGVKRHSRIVPGGEQLAKVTASKECGNQGAGVDFPWSAPVTP